jgi:hypothetical protein
MQVSELREYLLFCHQKDTEVLGIDDIPHKTVLKFNSVYVFQLVSEKEIIEEYFATTNDRNLNRYLDRFYLYTPDDRPDRHQ